MLWLPMSTALFYYLHDQSHLRRLTLYYELYRNEADENFSKTVLATEEVLLTHEKLAMHINQINPRHKDLILNNPRFEKYSFKERSLQMSKLEAMQQRYLFSCNFQDRSTGCKGFLHALVIYLANEESYFESFSVTVEEPVRKVIRVQELQSDDPDFDLEVHTKKYA